MAALWLILGACIGSALTFVFIGLCDMADVSDGREPDFFDRNGEG